MLKMTIYQRLLQYYLDSESYFGIFVSDFLENYNHVGECGDQLYPYKSDIYIQCKQKEKKDFGYVLVVPDKVIQKYYTIDFDSRQLFAIIFGMWYGLSNVQILQIADRRRPRSACDRLNFFLCNPKEKAYKSDLNRTAYLDNLRYQVYINEISHSAHCLNNRIVLDDTGDSFQVN